MNLVYKHFMPLGILIRRETEGLITWRISSRAEISNKSFEDQIVDYMEMVQPGAHFEVRKHNKYACSRSFFSPG